jgi:hypothetical protein
MRGDPILTGLVRAYIDGDLVARRALLDWLEERDDPRLGAVRDESIDWDQVAKDLTGYREVIVIALSPSEDGVEATESSLLEPKDWHHTRWLLECVRYGSSASDAVVAAVRQARKQWLEKLFTELIPENAGDEDEDEDEDE